MSLTYLPPIASPMSLPFGAGAGAGASALPYASAIPTLGPAPISIPGSITADIGLASRLGQTASSVGSGGGLASRLGSLASLGAPAAGVAANAGKLFPYGIARTVAPAGAGLFASGLIDRTNLGGQNSNIEQALQGGAAGAGIGATIGLMGGPFAGITVPGGALIGGGIGAAAGVIGNLLGGGGDGGGDDDELTPQQRLNSAITIAGLDRASSNEILRYYNLYRSLPMADAEGKEITDQADIDAAALAQVQPMIFAAMQQSKAQAQSSADMMALQAYAADLFSPLRDSMRQDAELYADNLAAIIPTLPSANQPFARADAARQVASMNSLADAYAAQAQILPMADRLTQYQGDMAQLGQQAFAQQFSGSGSGGSDLASLLAAG